jgi:hypothetical protein
MRVFFGVPGLIPPERYRLEEAREKMENDYTTSDHLLAGDINWFKHIEEVVLTLPTRGRMNDVYVVTEYFFLICDGDNQKAQTNKQMHATPPQCPVECVLHPVGVYILIK